ncbi:MAG: hypothetical protein BWX98_00220 [Candidatus Aminicenantes bacterium ADurb.Bin147]|nr:MAG: hypothetical protein BWX98_00220 [Candidatus Aminicenantes bacterium ADurb.Bin147]
MMTTRRRPGVTACLFVLAAFAAPLLSGQTLFRYKIRDFDLVYYAQAHEYIIEHLARSYLRTMDFYKKFFDYRPTQETAVFLRDFGDWGNGGATAVPRNLVFFELSPFDHVYDILNAYERISLVMHHEMVHVITMDKPVGAASFFRKLFRGKVMPDKENPLSMFYTYLTSPRAYAPRWYLEGIAVFMETWTDGGLGRSLGAYDEMMFRTEVLEDGLLYDALGLESEGTAVDFQIGALSYMYGTRFFSHLGAKYGPEKVVAWTSAEQGSKGYFAAEFKRTFGLPLTREWSAWIAAEKTWQEDNLARIRGNPVTTFKPLTTERLGSVSRAFHDPGRGKVYLGLNYPGQIPHLAAVDVKTGAIERLAEIKGGKLHSVCSLAFDREGGRLFFTSDNNSFRDLRVLDLATGRTKLLIKDLRAGDLVFNPADQSLWAIRHNLGLSSLIKVDPPYADWTALYGFDYFADVYDLDLSPDGLFLTAASADVSGDQRLVRVRTADVLQGRWEPETLFDFGKDAPASFRFSPDGRFLYGSSYYTGVSNIFRYDLERKTLDALSNCETGFFKPVPAAEDGPLLVFKYAKDGFVPGWIPGRPVEDVNAIRFLGQEVVDRHPAVKNWTIGSPADIRLENLTVETGVYNSFKDIRLNSISPILEGYKGSLAPGLRVEWRNPLRFNGFDLTASYSLDPSLPARERPHLGLAYHFWNWTFAATYNNASFYDLFGPTMAGRKGYSLAARYSREMIYDPPRSLRIEAQAAAYAGLDRMPDYQNIDATYDKLLTARAGIKYADLRRSIGAVEDEKGPLAHFFVQANDVNGRIYPRVYGRFDYGIALPLNHSSLWLRTSAGRSFGDRTNDFVKFFFGGFGNNWIDAQEENRYREQAGFPGVGINSIGGRSYAKGVVEWLSPPIRFRRLGWPSLYCTWARLALFAAGIATDIDIPSAGREVAGWGAQLDFRVVLFSTFNTTLSLGCARSYEKGRPARNEFMLSLKLF